MSDTSSLARRPALADRLPSAPNWRLLFNTAEPDASVPPGLRAAQLDMLRAKAPMRFALHCLSALLLVLLLGEHQAGVRVMLWLLVALAPPMLSLVAQLALPRPLAEHAPRILRRETQLIAVGTLAWVLVPIVFGTGAALADILAIWMTLTALIAGLAVTLAALPLALAACAAVLGLGLIVMMLIQGLGLLAVAAAGFSTAMLWCCITQSDAVLQRLALHLTLHEKRALLNLLMRDGNEAGGDWIWEIDSARRLTKVSSRLADLLQRPVHELEGQPLLLLLAGESQDADGVPESFRTLVDKLQARERFAGLVLPVDIAGETHWWDMSAYPRFDDAGTFLGFRGVGSDVTETHRSVDRISRMARFDTLTSLPNRAHIMETLDHALRAYHAGGARPGFLMIDLDRFKSVNDNLGHPVGDRLLAQVAERLRGLGGENAICGRLGGDEFAVVLRDASQPPRVQAFAQRIVDTLSHPYDVDRHRLVIGASVGIAVAPRDGRTADSLIRAADLALYQSKSGGGGRVHHYEQRFEADAEARRQMQMALQSALERQEFRLNYAPVIDQRTGRTLHMFAQIQWKSPMLGEVAPTAFLPVAQEAGLMRPLGQWALRLACDDARAWPDELGVRLTLTLEQIMDTNLVAFVVKTLGQTGVSPERLVIDISEATLQRAGAAVSATLRQLHRIGVQLSLGEFGTGTSALGHLSTSPFAMVGIHPQLIDGAAQNDRESAARLRAIITLAENLGIMPIVQGVHSEHSHRLAGVLGGRVLQGSYLAGPLAAADVSAHMTAPVTMRTGTDGQPI